MEKFSRKGFPLFAFTHAADAGKGGSKTFYIYAFYFPADKYSLSLYLSDRRDRGKTS